MCGIAGLIIRNESAAPADVEATLERMIQQVYHRGPDAGGTKLVGPAGLAHRRLAIIDLNARSAQPMTVADESIWIVFNGEIYNYLELRKELKEKGCVFRTESDTEVILWGWRVWGEDMVRRLRGMFAFALWDVPTRTMLLARDRFGKKPLFYSDQKDVFLFASEIKSMLEWPGFERRVNLEVISDYLSYGYCIGIDSALQNVKKLPQGHYMVVNEGKRPRVQRYWQLASIDQRHDNRSIDDLAHELIERLDDAIRCRMIADVPLGAFLSGGVDSSAVVARMSTMSSEPVKTFSVGFDIEGYNETSYAEEVARLFHTEHRSFIMDYGLIRELPRLVWHYGEPYADSSALVTFALAREIRKHVTVALSGDGGDEIFLGYIRYRNFQEQAQKLATGARPKLPYCSLVDEDQPFRIRDYYARRVQSFREEHKIAGCGANLVDHLFTPSSDRLGLSLEDLTPDNAIDRAARVEVDTYLPDDLLVKADIATMAVALEGRSPFLDHELADWGASLPQSKRVFPRGENLEMKALLKYAFEPYLPAELLYRRKQGFSVPVRHWMRYEIRDFMTELLTSTRFKQRGLVTPAFVNHMMERHFAGNEDHGTRLWTLLCLEMWFQTFIDRKESGPLDVDVMGHASSEQLRLVG